MRALAVSIHDVSPFTREAVTAVLAGLARAGVARVSLLVVPDYHHRGNITADPAFGAWLRELTAAGHEPVLHGYHHQRVRRPGESPRTRFFTRFYTADEGEFFDIGRDAARELLLRGRAEVARCAGAEPAGFIAPAWLLSPEGEAAARELGFAYTTRLESMIELASGRVHLSQSLCWSTRAAWRRASSLLWNALLFRRLRQNPLLRISIHPPNVAHEKIWAQIISLVRRALTDREPFVYCDLIGLEDGAKQKSA